MAKQKTDGFTLLEIIVSIAMIAIITVSVSSLIITNQRIEKSIIAKESLIFEINSIYQVFNDNPDNVINSLKDLYQSTFVENTNIITLFYDKEFRPNVYPSYKIDCELIKTIESNYSLYTLKLTVHGYDGYLLNEKLLSRTIKISTV